MGMFAVAFINHGDFIGNNVLVLHRVQGQIHACHGPHFACPQAASVYDVFGVNGAFIRHNIPCAIGALIGFNDLAMGFDCCAPHPRGLGIGVCRATWIKVTIQWIIKRTDNPIGVRNGRNIANFIWADDLRIKAHVAMLGPFRQQHVKAFLVIRQCNAAHVV